jgi:hypothetical protein
MRHLLEVLRRCQYTTAREIRHDFWRCPLVISEFGQAKGRLTPGIENGSPVMQLYDRDGVRRVTIGIPKDIGALIRIFDAQGNVQGRFP